MEKKKKSFSNIALAVITWLLIAFTVFMMVFTIVTVTTVNKNERNVFGFRFYIVQTDSMSLSENNADMDIHFDAGDIIIVKTAEDPTALQPGDVIAFISTNSVSYGETVTHMIRQVKKTDSGRVLGYVTYGTNTGTSDEALVAPEYILGVYAGKLPVVGRFFAFVKSTLGYITCIFVPFMILIIYNGVNVVRLFRRHKREQMAAIQAEKEQLEAERAETQRMMAELMALKAQLSQKEVTAAATVEPASEANPTEDDSSAGETDET